MKISVVTPLYGSAPYIEELHRRAVAAIRAIGADGYEIIFVNDNGPDDSLDVAVRVAHRDAHTIVIDLSRNFGQHQATMAGLAQATGDYVFILDSDLEEEPEWLGQLFAEMSRQHCDVVYAVSDGPKGGQLYALARAIYYKVLNFLSPIKFPVNVCTARLMSRRYVDALLQFGERELFMAGIWHMAGFDQMAIRVAKRDSSPTTYSFGRRLNVFVNAVTAFSTRPLVMISVLGMVLSLAALVFVGYVVFRKLVYGVDIEGWTSVMAAVLLIGGASLFFNGVMAIYIAKIFVEVKQRPRTIIRRVYRGEAGREEHGRAEGLPPARESSGDGRKFSS